MVFAKKSLGQHFLTSEKALRSIVTSAQLSAEDVVLEIGPGRGALTLPLLHTGAQVIAIEKDADMVSHLETQCAEWLDSGSLVLIKGDVRALDSDTLTALIPHRKYKIVANIPYYITGEIMRQFLTIDPQPQSMTLLVQKEVAERIARDKKESILSLSVKVYGSPHYIETVPAGAFNPPPSVDSAILHISNLSKSVFEEISESDFFAVVKTGFSSRRKQLRVNLRNKYTQESIDAMLSACRLRTDVRAEDIPCQTWVQMVEHLKEKRVY